MQIKVEVKNLEQIRQAFSRFPETVAPRLRDAAMKSAFLVERRGKELSPVDTGRLRSSIATSLGIANQGISSLVQTNVYYAIFVHEGTKRMAKRPFMQQAAEQKKEDIGKIYDVEITKALQDVANMAK